MLFRLRRAHLPASFNARQRGPFGPVLVTRCRRRGRTLWSFVDGDIISRRKQWRAGIVMKNNIEQRSVNAQMIAKIVVNKTELPESVHKEADPRARRPHHLRQSFLTQSRH